MGGTHQGARRDKAPRFALLHATVKSRMAYEAQEGGAATSRGQAGASQGNKQDCPGRTSSTCHPLTTRLQGGTEVTQHSWYGMESCQSTKRPSLHHRPLQGPRRHEALPSPAARRRTGSVKWKRSPAAAQRSPIATWPWPLLPPLPRRRRWPTPHSQSQDSRQSPGKIQGSESQSRTAEKCRARQGKHGDTTQNRG